MDSIELIGHAFSQGGADLLDVHSDADHNRTVFTLGGEVTRLTDSLVLGAGKTVELVDMTDHEGLHPCIGALDVLPIVYLSESQREVAEDTARSVSRRLSEELALPIFFYGHIASRLSRRERAYFRRGGTAELALRMQNGEIAPDLGPSKPHPTAVATLVTARPPLVAFNVELSTQDVAVARRIGEEIREVSGGLPGVRAIGVFLGVHGCVQVSTNVEDPARVPLGVVVETVREAATHSGVEVVCAEIVGLVPRHALDGFPEDVTVRDFDPDKQILERRYLNR